MADVELTWHDVLPSTMDAAHLLAANGAGHGTAVAARRQSAGRGTRGRVWDADDGGLWLSVIARPTAAGAMESLSLRVGLAAAAGLESALPTLPRVGLKWPNDLLLDDRKVGGLLCEARWSGSSCQWVVIGIGINVANTIHLQHTATIAEFVPDATAEGLAGSMAVAIAAATKYGGPLRPSEIAAFDERDVLRGRLATDPVRGTVEGINPSGALRIRAMDGVVHFVIDGLTLTAR